MNFIGVIADIVSSRCERDRGELQKKLIRVLAELNRDGSEVLASPYTITLGDEFQALRRSPRGLFRDLWRISATLHPARVRYSMALGRLSTPVNSQQALGMDGPVFYIARDGLEVAKKTEAMFRVGGEIGGLELINHSLMLISHMASDWNANRMAIQADLSGGMAVKEIARRVGISETAVYKNIRAAALETITAIAHDTERALAEGAGNRR